MPSYRSASEAEIRDAAIVRLRELMPGCRIIHEINCGSFGPNRLDLLAVTRDRIAAVEIKSEKDKLDRLPSQIASMRQVSHHAISALHEKFLTPLETRYSDLPAFHVPDAAKNSVVWAYPVKPRAGSLGMWELKNIWDKQKILPPPGFINLLWAGELRAIVRKYGLSLGVSKLDMDQMVDLIRWGLTGKLTLAEVCFALRRRECCEADPVIED